jgi:hypothetical protein
MRQNVIWNSGVTGAGSASKRCELVWLAADVDTLVNDLELDLSEHGTLSGELVERLHQLLERALSL